ncbi:MAG TPA: HAD-IA family hydrolase [Terracidiphilus sp.]|jgi:putative hydrolase of the HAD superfamily|nr:HAD-IA family hydrolase [Terracidiphilus sp.]
MFPFDVILFDVGGVLLTNGWDRRERAAAVERFGLDAISFEVHHLAAVDLWERGATTAEAYLDAAVFYEPRPFTREEFFSFILGQSQLLPGGAMGILAELAASKKCTVGALNNEARETNEHRFQHFGLRRYFDVAFSSCYVGQRKPKPAIYRLALDVMGVAPQRVLFIDDRVENAAAAADAGMQAIAFAGEQTLRSELASRGVL